MSASHPLSTPTNLAAQVSTTVQLSSQRIASGLANPLFVTAPPGDLNRLFVVEQKSGAIKILDLTTRAVLATPFLTLPASELLKEGFEQGMLGLAFHPNYATNGKFYVSYTAPGGGNAGQTKVVEYQVSNTDPNQANSVPLRTILTINQPQTNHNGGWLAFGPDGYLYWASGDGGGSGFRPGIPDESDNSQDITDNLLGKILRLDINGDAFPDDDNRNYAIPASNPFVGQEGDDEIWSYGLRNPWRPSFDRLTGDLYIADVGQGRREELNFQPATSAGGENYGWNFFEGTLSYKGTPPANLQFTSPIYEYDHSDNLGRSITGGYVYRGAIAALSGTYFWGDFTSGKLWSLRTNGSGISEFTDRTQSLRPASGSGDINRIASFGEDGAGDLYIVDLDGEIYRLVVQLTAIGTDDNDILSGGPDADTLRGAAGDDGLQGLGGNDVLSGEAGNDLVQGGMGADQISGGSGSDLLLGGRGADSLTGGSDRDLLRGANGNDAIWGGADDDQLLGGLGNDTLRGGLGNDQLTGTEADGNTDSIDSLTGGQGSDTFILGSATQVFYDDGNATQPGWADYALIEDFDAMTDVIQLAGSASRYLLGTAAIASITGTALYLDTDRNGGLTGTDELIAIARNTAGLSLTAPYFTYV